MRFTDSDGKLQDVIFKYNKKHDANKGRKDFIQRIAKSL